MSILYRCATAVTFLALATPCIAEAQSATEKTMRHGPAEDFGGKGQIAVSSDASLSIQHTSISGGGSVTTVELAPALDYFVTSGLSIGGFIGFNYATAGDNHASRFSIGPRVGYNITLSDLVSLWPKIGFSYAHTSVTGAIALSSNTTIETTHSGDALAINIFVPFMFHPATHFFVGFGPFLDADLSGNAKATVFGGKLTLGGWVH